MLPLPERRQRISKHFDSREKMLDLLIHLQIEVTRTFHFKVREERTPSAFINKDGSVFDFSTHTKYDVVSLLVDGYMSYSTPVPAIDWLEEYVGLSPDA